MTVRRRRSDWSGRSKLHSPGRPDSARREELVRFWAAIATGRSSEDAARDAGVSPPVGSRWFRKSGGMPPSHLSQSAKPLSGRYLSFEEREEIALLRAQGRGIRHIACRLERPVPSIYSIVPPNDGSALRHGHHFEPVNFVIDQGRDHHDAYSAGSCQRSYARACGCRQGPRRHREELIEPERGWSGREAFVTMMQTADLGQGNDRSGPGRLNGSSIRCVLADRQVGP